MTYKEMLRVAMEQTAIDMNCHVDDLSKEGNTVVISHLNKGAKKCYKNKISCGFAYYGEGFVASVDKSIKPTIESYISKHPAYRNFDGPQIFFLNKELEPFGKSVCYLAEFFLPDLEKPVEINKDITTIILHEEDIPELFEDHRFHNALGYDQSGAKQDVLAVVGYMNGEVVGVAGASNDCETMWQIGIDVVPKYRRMKVASTLTKILTDEIVKAGKVPYYCTAWSNIASKNNAIKCGYKTAWVELTAVDSEIAKGYMA